MKLNLKTYLLCTQLVLQSTSIFASTAMFDASFDDPYRSSQISMLDRNYEAFNKSKTMFELDDEVVVEQSVVDEELKISLSGGSLELSQTFLDFAGINYTYTLKGSSEIAGLQIFVRDNSLIKFDKTSQTFSAIKSGSTEVVFVGNGQMLIIPVKVGNEFRAPTFAVNESFVQVEASYETPREVVTIEQAEDQLASTFSYENTRTKFSFEETSAQSKTAELTIQVVDERSSIEDDRIYPVVGLDVRIIGSSRTLRTDARGIVQFTEIPVNSRVIVETFDAQGQYVPSKTEAVVEKDGVVRLKVLSSRKFMFMSEVTGHSFNTAYGSVCFNLKNSDGSQRLSEVSIVANTQEIDAIYWGQYGPDLGAISTGSSGRACFVNIDNGIHEFSVSDANGVYSNFTYPIFKGYHNEEDVFLENGGDLEVTIAALATANEQLYSDEKDASVLRPVDDVNIVEVGLNENLEKLTPGTFKLLNSTKIKGRRYILNRSPEFADSIHTIDDGRSEVLTLVHRGFFEDLFHELYLDSAGPSIAYDQAQAQIMLQYHDSEIENARLKIVDTEGREVETGWYLPSSEGIHKAVFFNLEPGIYQVIISSQDGSWLDTTTVALDYWTNAVVNLGSELKAKKFNSD